MIYAAQPIAGGPVKIGHSADVPARIRQLEAHYGQPLALLATLPGGPVEERAIHAKFAHLRFGRTERFQPASDLMAFLGRPLLVGANPDAVEAMDGAPRCSSPVKLAKTLARMAKAVADSRGVPLGQYLSEVADKPISRDYAQMLRELDEKETE